ncbi:MAG: ankyrin repeat domain-containing protein [Betaproteobacteria bacterium]|nr:ankyrin repeat domain-containing protein [Betaproteobacteria bacterium]
MVWLRSTKLIWILSITLFFFTTNTWSTNNSAELNAAAEMGNFPLVRQILETADFEQDELNVALFTAVQKGNPEIVRRILDAGADVHYRAPNDYTSLIQAAHDGRHFIVEILLAANADVNAIAAAADNNTALTLAAEKNRREVVAQLLAANADIEATISNGMTALMLAAQEGHHFVIQALTNAQANVNYALENGATALMFAIQHGHYNSVYALIIAKADLNVKAANGMTPLKLAGLYRYSEIIKLLKDAGAK